MSPATIAREKAPGYSVRVWSITNKSLSKPPSALKAGGANQPWKFRWVSRLGAGMPHPTSASDGKLNARRRDQQQKNARSNVRDSWRRPGGGENPGTPCATSFAGCSLVLHDACPWHAREVHAVHPGSHTNRPSLRLHCKRRWRRHWNHHAVTTKASCPGAPMATDSGQCSRADVRRERMLIRQV